MKFSSTLIGLFAGAALSLATPTALSAQPTDPTNGGEGGKVIRVTTLAKDGPGSLAEALAGTGPRIIVFEVGGAIDLERSSLRIDQPYVTIAGQTAPSPGITLLRGGIDVATHDVKISHLRILTGVDGQAKRSGWEADAFSTIAAHDDRKQHLHVGDRREHVGERTALHRGYRRRLARGHQPRHRLSAQYRSRRPGRCQPPQGRAFEGLSHPRQRDRDRVRPQYLGA